MTELELFLLRGGSWLQTSTCGPCKISWKKSKLYIWIVVVTLKVTSCRTMREKKKWKSKILWAKQTIFLSTLPFSPWAVSATWLHVEHRISNSCTWASALLGRLFPSPNWPLWKFYPPKFPATLILKTMMARRSPLYFRTVGGQENHVQGALLIESSVVRE
jgi:hypothetical protein